MDKIRFDKWMEEVDDLCYSEFGMSIHDLPDMNFASYFEDGCSPTEFMMNEIRDMEALGDLIMS